MGEESPAEKKRLTVPGFAVWPYVASLKRRMLFPVFFRRPLQRHGDRLVSGRIWSGAVHYEKKAFFLSG